MQVPRWVYQRKFQTKKKTLITLTVTFWEWVTSNNTPIETGNIYINFKPKKYSTSWLQQEQTNQEPPFAHLHSINNSYYKEYLNSENFNGNGIVDLVYT